MKEGRRVRRTGRRARALMAALCILRHLGTLGLFTSAEGISAIGAALHGLVRVGRWWRDVKPPEPKARCAKEQ